MINKDYLSTSKTIKEEESKNIKTCDLEILLPGTNVKAYYVKPTTIPITGIILFTHWLASKPDANRTQFLSEANELAQFGFASLLVDTFFANWPKAKKKWTGTDAQFDKSLVIEQVQQLKYCLRWVTNEHNQNIEKLILVGHDFGAMFNTLLLSNEPLISGFVFMAGIGDFSDWFTMRKKMTDNERNDYINKMKDVAPIEHIALGGKVQYLFQFGTKDKSFVPKVKSDKLIEKVQAKQIEVKYYNEGHAIHNNEQATSDRINWIKSI